MLVYHTRLTVHILRQEIQLTLNFCALCIVFVTAFKEELLLQENQKSREKY